MYVKIYPVRYLLDTFNDLCLLSALETMLHLKLCGKFASCLTQYLNFNILLLSKNTLPFI